MKKLQSFFNRSELLKVGSANSASLILKLISAFITSKLTAIVFGSTGISLLGNWRNATELIQKISTGSIHNGVIKYAADSQNSSEETSAFQSTLFYVSCIICLLIMLVCFVFASNINNLIFIQQDHSDLIRILAFVLPLYVLNIHLQSILKAYQKFNKVVQINIFGHVFNLLFFVICIYLYGLKGALLSVAIVPCLLGVYSFYVVYKSNLVFHKFQFSKIKKLYVLGFRDYALMTIISTLIFPLTYLSIRNLLSEELSLKSSGYWEAMFRISTLYITFAISLINLIILPKLANSKTASDFRQIVFQFYKQFMPFFIGGLILVFFLKNYIVKIVLTNEFLPTTQLFLWQEVGDLFRVLALVLVAQFHAKKMIWHYIITDILLAFGLYFSTYILINRFGLKSAVIGHAITYAVYFLIILAIFKNALIANKST
ncbi:polysaccharide transporter, PST family [Psychroflexus salarius]|uniref:Polysaccharide transporter, PST family n=1 Tax=Psychroflexus salarius TaxID=1155689 RepID=A0A1M4W7H9_9FLAO|nr:O-antigen translocase [Psychroflexus salarius]SHE76922.1 polysaccharide transporter, PST family [Psychroflexus salarius]